MKTRALVLSGRDALHFIVAFAASFLTLWQAAGSPLSKAGLYALAPAVATVLFRQLCPNVGRVQAVVSKYTPAVDAHLPTEVAKTVDAVTHDIAAVVPEATTASAL